MTQLDASMKAAGRVTGPAARASTWAGVDRQLVTAAVAIPWAFDKQANIEGTHVHGINDPRNSGAWDYNYTSLK